MHFQGPEATDLATVTALNQAFIALLQRHSALPGKPTAPALELAARLARLPESQVGHLIACPFLLMSFDEAREDWDCLFDDETVPLPDLIEQLQRPPLDFVELTAAVLGFLWELSRRNPYATRLVSGASMHWCEALAECSALQLMEFVALQPCLLELRVAADKGFWRKLLAAGTSDVEDIRQAAHLCALQSVLTHPTPARYEPLSTAACKAPAPAMRVAERRNSGRDD